jgi:hypothetical protein
MANAFRYCAATLVLLMVTAIQPAAAQFQFPWAPSPPPTILPPPGIPKPPPNLGPKIDGNWGGQLAQLDGTAVNFELVVTANGGYTKYPDLDCTGKLRQTGSSKSYAFFVEIVAKGRADKGGRCQDGSVTISRRGDKLTLVWFGNLQDNVIFAYGTLSRKKQRSQFGSGSHGKRYALNR